MSQTVVIPNNEKPFWECEVNGKKYSYLAGSTVSVPDEVAEVIDNINAMKPTEDAPGTEGQVWTVDANGRAGWADLPTYDGD